MGRPTSPQTAIQLAASPAWLFTGRRVKHGGVIHYPRGIRVFAASLSALAGYVDAIGYIKLGGFFVSFMSGNSTRLGVGLAQANPQAAVAAGLIACFLLGVVAGSLIGHFAGARRRPVVLLFVAALLAAAAALAGLGADRFAVGLMAAAMGAENAVFAANGEVRIGLTYMTGTLVKLGQRIAEALLGRDRFGWSPYLKLWLGLVLGGLGGALAYGAFGLGALWSAAIAAAALAAVGARLAPQVEELGAAASATPPS
jgi:uncharacterized membrane protein YoaK (UPF0700 family)